MKKHDRDRIATALEDAGPDLLRFLARRTSSSDDAADLLGHIALTAWRRRRSAPSNDAEIRLWLFGIARHSLSNHWRASKRALALTRHLKEGMNNDTIAADITEQIAERDRINQALGTLSPEAAELMRLVHWDDLTLQQAATLLRIPPSTARSRYAAAKARLRDQLITHDPSTTGDRPSVQHLD